MKSRSNSFSRILWLPLLTLNYFCSKYGEIYLFWNHHKCLSSLSYGFTAIINILMRGSSSYVRIWRTKTVPALKGLPHHTRHTVLSIWTLFCTSTTLRIRLLVGMHLILQKSLYNHDNRYLSLMDALNITLCVCSYFVPPPPPPSQLPFSMFSPLHLEFPPISEYIWSPFTFFQYRPSPFFQYLFSWNKL